MGDVVDVRSGKDYKHLSEGNIPVYGTGGFMLSVNQALSYDEDAIGIGRKGTIDKPYILKAPFWTVDTLFYAIPREKVDLNFAFDVFQNIDWKKKDESTGVPSLSKTAINEIDVLVPQYDEQQPLGQFFNRIDNLITLHQCKCQIDGCRFQSPLAITWEQRKLGEVAEFSKGSGYSKGDLVEYGTPIILYGRLYTNYETRISDVDTFVEAKVGSVYSKGGEVVVPASGETAEDIARAATVDKSGILLGGDLNIVMPNKDINSSFLAISISSGNPQRELAKKAQGKSVVHIHNEEIKNLVLPFPIKDEQNKIASYFCQLDNLITLHQCE